MPVATKADIDKRVEGQTVASRFVQTVAEHPDTVALRWKQADDSWGEITYREYGEQAARVAGGLAALGLNHRDRIVLMMRNRPEFHITDAAALLCATPDGPTTTAAVRRRSRASSEAAAAPPPRDVSSATPVSADREKRGHAAGGPRCRWRARLWKAHAQRPLSVVVCPPAA